MSQSLWPDFSNMEKIKMPKQILEEQASYLVNATKGDLYASVEEKSFYDNTGNIVENINGFDFDFFIKAKYMPSYKFKMFTIKHNIVAYPISMVLDPDIGEEIYDIKGIYNLCDEIEGIYDDFYTISGIKNEENFKQILAYIFKTVKVKNVINSLMSLS